MSHNNTSATRSNAARNNTRKNTAASQQVANTQTQGTPVPAKLADLESRLSEYNTALSDAKKKSQKASENLAKARDLYDNERYCVALCRNRDGKASAEDLALISSRKAEENATTAIAKAMASMPKDTDDVAKARELAKSEEGSLTAAINETLRNWTKCYATLYKSIGITSKSDIKPELLKGICPYLMVATEDGLKAAFVTKTAVRKNGVAVKVDGKRVYKFSLRERSRWSAYGLFETLERNTHWASAFTADELKVRTELLNAEVAALKALKVAKESVPKGTDMKKSKFATAANAAAQATQANTAANTAHTTKGGVQSKVG